MRTVWFGTGETRLCSLVSKDRAYKPMVKSSGVQRESDGVAVLLGAGHASGGKDPDFDHAGGGGKRQGMKRARQRVKALTDRRRVGLELADIIAGLNLFLRGWGNHFRTGNASTKFRQLDRHVA